jgi:hypothetical protein
MAFSRAFPVKKGQPAGIVSVRKVWRVGNFQYKTQFWPAVYNFQYKKFSRQGIFSKQSSAAEKWQQEKFSR